MIKLKDLLSETKTTEIENNLSFKVMGINNEDLIITGKKIELTLSFRGKDLQKAIEGKTKRGKVVLAGVKIK
jgi:hypothetical protein|tara:strand:+ start:386 stop:601 length:216 start_codon:yes stop_codon:yes gene_type:complete